MIEVSPLPVRKMIIERGPSATFRASEGGVASVCQPKIDLVLLRVESNVLNPPGVLESQESGEESSVMSVAALKGARFAGQSGPASGLRDQN